MNKGSKKISVSLRNPVSGDVAIAAYLTAGFPTKDLFLQSDQEIAGTIDVLEIGVPFSDPMADGPTIQRTSEVGLSNGATLEWILESVPQLKLEVPVVLMSYLNPLVSFGVDRLLEAATAAGVAGLIIPDLPLEEAQGMVDACNKAGIALIQLVTPTTPPERLESLCKISAGFVYAVATTGITGGESDTSDQLTSYLQRVRQASELPVLAGFGIRNADQVKRIANWADGVVVGSALLEAIEGGIAPSKFIRGLLAADSS
jgi:tryptophan synthase alpha chain